MLDRLLSNDQGVFLIQYIFGYLLMNKRKNNNLSRREFLRLGSIGFIAASSGPFSLSAAKNNFSTNSSLPKELIFNQASDTQNYGRVMDKLIHVHSKPSFESPQIHSFKQDSILPIRKTVLDIDLGKSGKPWIEIKKDAYLHSSLLQPVTIKFNSATMEISKYGALAEVTVPYTNAYPRATFFDVPSYRCYYNSTYWVKRMVLDQNYRPWYEIKDDKDTGNDYYVPAQHLRLIPYSELSLLSPKVPLEEKRIKVDLSSQTVTAYEYDKPVFTAIVSTGDVQKNIYYTTPIGEFNTFYKRPTQHLLASNILFGGYDLPGVPWLSYITNLGIAFHGAFWHNDFGNPKSHGCINLSPDDAKWIYRWTTPYVTPQEQLIYNDNPEYGTKVEVI